MPGGHSNNGLIDLHSSMTGTFSDVSEQTKPFEFQAFAWSVDDGVSSEDDYENMDFTVHVFGKTRSGESVALHVSGYAPSFCVRFAEQVSDIGNYESLSDLLRLQLKLWDFSGDKVEELADLGDHLIELADGEKVLRKKTLWGFENSKQYPFFKYAFKSQQAYNKLKGLFNACGKHTLTTADLQAFYDEVLDIREENKDYSEREQKREQTNGLIEAVSIEKQISERVLRWVIKLGDAELPMDFARAKLFEVIDPILRFAHLRDLRMAGWIRLANPSLVPSETRQTTCSLEFVAQYEDLSSWENDDICPTIKEFTFDIESYSFNDLFPDPNLIENCVFQIAVTLKEYADTNIRRILLHLRTPENLRGEETGRCADINEIEVENYETEKELLLRFAEIIIQEDPDILYGYNSDQFDWNYVMVRAQITGCANRFSRLSRMLDHVCTVEEKAFKSAAYGDNKYLRVDIPGRLNVDLMIWVQRNMPQDRYPSYALDVVAETEIGQNKHDVDYKQIFAAYRTGNEEKCTEVGDYCCQDAVLVQRLCIKLDVVTQMFEMSNITHTPPMYLLQKGQEVKAFSQISKKAMQEGFLVPQAEERSEGSFTGAIVLTPAIGQYLTPVAVLDFASLYPSIQVAFQVCYSTIVLKQCPNCKVGKIPCQRSLRQQCMDNLPGVEYSTIEWYDDQIVYREKGAAMRPRYYKNLDEARIISPKKVIEANIARNDPTDDVTWRIEKKHYRYRFAQGQASVIPDLQVELKKNRKAVKRMMGPLEHSKDPDDQLRYRVLNGRQLAIKVSMNSIYGFTSAFKLNLVELSAAVTAKGRQMIEQTRAFMETRFESLAVQNLWTVDDTRTYYDKAGREVVADSMQDGWIRKFPTAVAGRPWTEKPLSINVVGGDSVTGDTPILCRMHDGTMTYRTIDRLGSGSWETRVDGKEYQLCDDLEVWSDTGFTPVRHIIRHAVNKRMFRVRTMSGFVDVTEDHSLLRPNGDKVKPKDLVVGEQLLHADLPTQPIPQKVAFDEDRAEELGFLFAHSGKCEIVDGMLLASILNAKETIRLAFSRGFADGDGYVETMEMGQPLKLDCADKAKITIAGLYHLYTSIGYTVTLNQDSMFCYRGNGQLRSMLKRHADEIIDIALLTSQDSEDSSQFVYDIETESHHFHVGPGRLQAHNTDSVFCNFPLSTLPETISLCHKAEVILTEEVFNRAPIEMEYEKTYLPMIIQKKKNYIGLKYEMDDKRWKVDFKGIAVKRRNYCQLVKTVFWNVIYPALGIEPIPGETNQFRKVTWDFREGPDRAVEALQSSLKKLEDHCVNIDDLVITASLKSNYKNENLPHIQLAKRMKERDAGSAPQSGQRFGFIYVNEASRGNQLCAKTEDPRYAKVNKLQPDWLFYLDNQIRKPLVKFLTLIGKKDATERIFLNVQTELFKQRKQERSVLEKSRRATFCTASGQGIKRAAVAPIAPLKPPKKTFVSKKQRLAQIVGQSLSLSSFVTKKTIETATNIL